MCTEKPIEELILNAKELDFTKSYFEKQMKIVKAVAELGCDEVCPLNALVLTHVAKATEFNPIYDEGSFIFVSLLKVNKYWDLVCTIEEYNQCIEEMKYHYDIPRWCSYNRADKELLTVENSDYSFYGKETFVYGQDVYAKDTHFANELIKFGCLTLDGNSAILLVDAGHMVYPIAGISSKPFKSKEDLELEEAKKKQVHDSSFIYSHYFKSIDEAREMFLDMQNDGRLAEIILPLEKK